MTPIPPLGSGAYMELCYSYCSKTYREIGETFVVDYSKVSDNRKRLNSELKSDRKPKKTVWQSVAADSLLATVCIYNKRKGVACFSSFSFLPTTVSCGLLGPACLPAVGQ